MDFKQNCLEIQTDDMTNKNNLRTAIKQSPILLYRAHHSKFDVDTQGKIGLKIANSRIGKLRSLYNKKMCCYVKIAQCMFLLMGGTL